MREKVQDGFVCPFALVYILFIFGETRQIYNSELRTYRWPNIMCGFTNQIKTSPGIHSKKIAVFIDDF